MFWCDHCKKRYIRGALNAGRACAVLHRPGSCCHYNDREAPQVPPGAFPRGQANDREIPWPLRGAYAVLDSALEFMSSLGYRPDWYKEEWQR